MLAHDALYEHGYQHLFRLHALDGDPAGAIRTYQVCRDILFEEFEAAAVPSFARQPIPAPTALPGPPSGPRQAPAAPERPGLAPVWTFLNLTHLSRALLSRASRLLRAEVAAFVHGNTGLVTSNGHVTVTMNAEAAEVAPGSFISVRGTSSGIPRRALMWTVVHTNGYFWPQTQVFRFGERWTGYARIGDSPADSGKRLEVLAMLVDRQTDDDFRQWLRNGDRNVRDPPVVGLPPGAQIAARLKVAVT